jgi:hypothetical protein
MMDEKRLLGFHRACQTTNQEDQELFGLPKLRNALRKRNDSFVSTDKLL